MLKVLIGLLLVANALLWAWRSDHLASWGLPAKPPVPAAAIPEVPIDPERIVPSNGATAPPSALAQGSEQALTSTTAAADWLCWRLGPFAASQQLNLQALMPLNNDRLTWDLIETALEQRWAVVTARSPSGDLTLWVNRAREGRIAYRTSEADTLKGRLILAAFNRRDLAERAVSQLTTQGWSDLDIVRERPPLTALSVELKAADEGSLDQIKMQLQSLPVLGEDALQISTCPKDFPTLASEQPMPAPVAAPSAGPLPNPERTPAPTAPQ